MVSKASAQAPQAANDTLAATPVVDQEALDVKALAKGVLAREFRPKVSTVRRLAEAVLAKDSAVRKKKKKKASGAGKSGGKKRKLARIPGQKDKK